jgi:hypothetical protein
LQPWKRNEDSVAGRQSSTGILFLKIRVGEIYKKAEHEFGLSDPALNIWGGVREDAITYLSPAPANLIHAKALCYLYDP